MQAFQDLWANERLLNVIEQFIGPDIAGHPVWNLRTKVSENNNNNNKKRSVKGFLLFRKLSFSSLCFKWLICCHMQVHL